MKRAVRLTLALILCSSGLQAQDADSSATPVTGRPQSAVDPAAASASASPASASSASASQGAGFAAAQAAVSPDEATIERAYRLRDASPWLAIPKVSPESGPLSVPAGEQRAGPLAVEGTLEVLGTVTGDAVAYGGDLIVRPGGVVQGRAIALVGQVRVEPGGLVEGESVSLRGAASSVVAPVSAGERTRHALVLVLAWLAVVIPIAVGVLVFAGAQLEAVTESLASSVSRSFLVGLVGQLALIPVLLLLIVALAITIIGVLVIPIAVVAYTIAAAGLLMLGFLAAARLLGGALGGGPSPDDDDSARRRRLLRSLLAGIMVLFVPWLLVAALSAVPLVASVVHAMAMLLTWVALTSGFGAAIRSRAGRRRAGGTPQPAALEDEVSWQTPTPVGGVVAARRPTPAASSRSSS